MRITFEGLEDDFQDYFSVKQFYEGLSNEFEMKLAGQVHVCKPISLDVVRQSLNYRGDKFVTFTVSAVSERKLKLQEISDAKALVNKTKEAHKEAQRKLAELQKGEK